MTTQFMKHGLMTLAALGLAVAAGTGAQAQGVLTSAANVTVFEVYGGGGGNTAGAPYANDFVELFNNSPLAVDLSTYSLQYSSATGTTGSFTAFNFAAGTTIGAGQYFFILGGNNGGTVGAPLPTGIADASFSNLNISNSAGQIALVSNQTALTQISALGNVYTATPYATSGIVDFVGFGSTANRYEGTGPITTAAGNTYGRSNSVERVANATATGYQDTNVNSTDFTVTATPTLQNSTTPYGQQFVAPAPEPSGWVAMLVGMGALGLVAARRRTAQAA